MLLDWYLPIKTAHVSLVLCSGSLFALRGLCVLAGADWPQRRTVRVCSQCIDSALLAAAVLLLFALKLNPFALPWLCVKLALLPAYVGLGIFALRLAPTRRGKALCFVLALCCFGMMLSVAISHHPLGIFARLLG